MVKSMKKYFLNVFPENRSKNLENFLEKTKKELDKFFKIKMEKPFVFLINSRRDFDKIRGIKTEKWQVGFAERYNIFIMNLKVYTKESCHKNAKDFWKTLKHEFCHLYFNKVAKTNRPFWLNEGTACYLTGQNIIKPQKEEVLNIFKYHNKSDSLIYQLSTFWVRILIKKFGRNKFCNLIKSINGNPGKNFFAANFRKIYGINYSKKDFGKLVLR